MTVSAHVPRTTYLPPGIVPRGLSRMQAAEYVGVSPTFFDAMVADGRMPKPVRVAGPSGKRGRVLWDARRLDSAFDALHPEDEVDTEAENTDRWKVRGKAA